MTLRLPRLGALVPRRFHQSSTTAARVGEMRGNKEARGSTQPGGQRGGSEEDDAAMRVVAAVLFLGAIRLSPV